MIENILLKIRYFIKIKLHHFFNKNVSSNGRIGKYCSINLGNNINIGDNFWLSNCCRLSVKKNATLTIGNDFSSNNNLFMGCRNNVVIGNNVNIGPNVVIVDNDHDYRYTNSREYYVNGTITIGNNVWIGANCVILKNSFIEDNAVIAAGTIVKGKVPKNVVFYNNKTSSTKKYKQN